jgi:hypothetical protein
LAVVLLALLVASGFVLPLSNVAKAATSTASSSAPASTPAQTPPWLEAILKAGASNVIPTKEKGAVPMDINLGEEVNIKGQTESNYLYYSPSEIQEAYDATPLYTAGYAGAGQTIAIVDAWGDPYIQSELNAFDSQFGLPAAIVHVVCVDGPCNYAEGITEGWNGEIALDVEWSHAMAPDAAIYLYIGSTNAQPLYDAVAAAVAGTNGNGTLFPIPSVISMSWGQPENDLGESAAVAPVFGENYPWLNQVFQYGTSQGITFFASTGDWGAYDQSFGQTSPYGGAIYPSTDPFVTAVGGTSLYMSTTSGLLQAAGGSNAVGSYGYETAWSWNNYYGWGTGGGDSTLFGEPSWQAAASVPSNGMRGVPDVAWDADPLTGVIVYVSGGFWVYGGTSVGSPSWAGSMALIDSVAGHGLGFINPELYSIYSNPTEYASAFHDVTVGDNDPNLAAKGWDPLTGMGTPDIANLASLLTAPAPSTSLSVLASNSVALGTSASYGSPVTITAAASGVSTCTGSAIAVLTSSTGAAIGTSATNPVTMTCSSGTWTGIYTPVYPTDPAGMWTATVTITGSSASGTGMTTFSVGDGITLFSGWGFFLAGDTVPIIAVVTAPGGSVVTSGTFTATFYYETPSGTVESVPSVSLSYDPTTCVEPGVCAFDGSFTIPSSADQGPWVMTITGSDGSNVAATAYSWLNVGLVAYTYTDSPTYLLGGTTLIQSFIYNPDTASYLATGSYTATVIDYSATYPSGTTVGAVSLAYVGYGTWFTAFSIPSTGPAGFYRVVVTGSDGLGNDANGETLVRVAPLPLTVTVTAPSLVVLPSSAFETVSASAAYPNGTAMTVGSVDVFTTGFYAPMTYNTVAGEFVAQVPVPTTGGSYVLSVSAFDPLGNSGAWYGSFTVVQPSVTTLVCASPDIVNHPSVCTATVTGASPTGTMSFSASGSGTFIPSSATCTLDALSSCSVLYVPSTTTGSPQTITASYSGDTYNLPSSGTAPITVISSPLPSIQTVTTVRSTWTSVAVGATEDLVMTVTPSATGTVSFMQYKGPGLVSFSESTFPVVQDGFCTLSSGSCSVPVTGVNPGNVTIWAEYSGDSTHFSSSDIFTITVTQVSSAATVNSAAMTCTNPSVAAGTSITCEATVEGSAPTGNVTWSQTGTGSVTLSSSACTLSSSSPSTSECQVTVTGETVGSTTLKATYGGVSGSAAVTVTAASAVESTNGVTIRCSGASAVVGSSVTCKATVAGSSPTGKVTWSSSGSGRFSAQTCKLSKEGSCSVKYTLTSASSPVSIVKATYAGDKSNPSSFGTVSLTVAPKASVTVVSCKPTSAVSGSSKTITCKAKVTGYSPTGIVTWSQSGTGSVSFSSTTCTLTSVSRTQGTCSVTMTGTTAGKVTLQATYSGDPNNQVGSGTAKLTIKNPT